ncbi:MAG: archaeosortase/exosortase family protein [Deltaproteobacteria bacterium]|nr:archaeosortase/exosortase family protein [Deltaproteobacteria bacterium]MBF0525571.1 archaeosortase/exosortase family protein [Deltaproteobacteria bacterium]
MFFVLFILIQTIHYATRSWTEPFLVKALHVGVSSKIINILTPQEASYIQDKVIRSGSFGILVDDGCDGVEAFILILAAICAFPAGPWRKTVGAVGGLGVVYFFNLARIVCLYYINKYHEDVFDVMHIYVGQTFMVIIGLMIFIFWAVKFSGNEQNQSKE